MYDSYEDEYEHGNDDEPTDTLALVWLGVIIGGTLLVAFTGGVICGVVLG